MNMVQGEVGCCCSELLLQCPEQSSPRQGLVSERTGQK